MDGNLVGISMGRIKDIPKTDQPREKALFYGINSLSNAELLALLVSSGTKNHSALEVSYEMLSHFNGLDGIVNASINELTKINGINKIKALKLKASFILYERAREETHIGNFSLKGREEIALYFHDKLYKQVQEKAFVVIVDGKNNVKSIKEIFKGSTHKMTISPKLIIREVMEKGIRFFLIHNHPSNICEPSNEDMITTSQIEMMSYTFGLQLVDHLIITKDNYYSISDNKRFEYKNKSKI